jgi:hypothetical protein
VKDAVVGFSKAGMGHFCSLFECSALCSKAEGLCLLQETLLCNLPLLLAHQEKLPLPAYFFVFYYTVGMPFMTRLNQYD